MMTPENYAKHYEKLQALHHAAEEFERAFNAFSDGFAEEDAESFQDTLESYNDSVDSLPERE